MSKGGGKSGGKTFRDLTYQPSKTEKGYTPVSDGGTVTPPQGGTGTTAAKPSGGSGSGGSGEGSGGSSSSGSS